MQLIQVFGGLGGGGRVGLTGVLALLGMAIAPSAQERCQPGECLRAIGAEVAVEALSPAEGQVVGWWSHGGGLSGNELYLFDDHTYLFTEWADVWPETIDDKGQWTLSDGFLQLTADADVTWRAPVDRRYLFLRTKGRAKKTLLVGLDWSMDSWWTLIASPDLARFERNHASLAAGCLETVALKRKQGWTAGEATQTRARLLKDAWRPEAH